MKFRSSYRFFSTQSLLPTYNVIRKIAFYLLLLTKRKVLGRWVTVWITTWRILLEYKCDSILFVYFNQLDNLGNFKLYSIFICYFILGKYRQY